jgi:hypothetical protein
VSAEVRPALIRATTRGGITPATADAPDDACKGSVDIVHPRLAAS